MHCFLSLGGSSDIHEVEHYLNKTNCFHREKVSGIALVNKQASFCLLNQFDLQSLFTNQHTWYFLLNKQKRVTYSFNEQINCAYRNDLI